MRPHPLNRFWLRLCTTTASALIAGSAFGLTNSNDSFVGPNWEECLDDPDNPDCDAGNTIVSAQSVRESATGELRQISGVTRGSSGFFPGVEGDWQDIYQIFISNPANFQATTLANNGGFAEFDSMLWLFSDRGTALLANNNAGQGEPGSILLNESSNGDISLQDIGPGIYYIAISGFDSSPLTENFQDMFPVPLPDGQVSGPTQDGFLFPQAGWFPETTPSENGDYIIRFPPNSVSFIPFDCGEEQAGDCFSPNGTPGCDRLQCCTKICFEDPYCCETAWDQQCANQAIEKCKSCGNPGAGPCGEAHPGPYCDDESCCQAVCEIDPLCCIIEWDQTCASKAQKVCGLPCSGKCPGDFNNDGDVNGGDLGVMLARWDQLGCGDLNHDGLINGGDIGLLLSLFGPCSNCGLPNTGGCYEAKEYVGCEDEDCCDTVCTADPFCCQTAWDANCASAAAKSCSSCGNPSNGSCFEEHKQPNCNNPECCAIVCLALPHCCDVKWDTSCKDKALLLCENSCGHPNAGPCDIEHPSAGCADENCCQAVCEILPRCCEVFWDTDCANTAIQICNP